MLIFKQESQFLDSIKRNKNKICKTDFILCFLIYNCFNIEYLLAFNVFLPTFILTIVIDFILNSSDQSVSVPPGMTLLDFVRYNKHLTGTKIGCREGDCGACTVLIGEIIEGELAYRSVTSCLTPMGNIHGKHVVTIEGINNETLNPIQESFCNNAATQCGFCTPGFVMSLNGFCLSNNSGTVEDAIASIDGNICRCTGYKSIEKASIEIAALKSTQNSESNVDFAIKNGIVPAYFSEIKSRLIEWNEKLISLNQDLGNAHHFVGGGTDLYVQKHDEMVDSEIDFVFDLSSHNHITIKHNACFIGSAITVSDLVNSETFNSIIPDIKKYAKLVSSTPIRNMATLAGNFANASPIGDFTIFFLALNAKLHLLKGDQKRVISLESFYKGYKTLDKSKDEVIETIEFEIPSQNAYFNFEKVSKRTHLDIASVNTAILLDLENECINHIRISVGGVGPIPQMLPKTMEFLKGKKVDNSTLMAGIDIAQTEISPISDVRGTEAYKRLLMAQLIKAHFIPFLESQNAVFAS